MKKRIFLKLFLGFILILIIAFAGKFGVELWLERKIESELKNVYEYTIDIKKINIDILSSMLELNHIKIFSDPKKSEYYAEIRSVKFSGINYINAVLHKDLHIDKIAIKNSSFKAKLPFRKNMISPAPSPFRIGVGGITIDQFDLELVNDSAGPDISILKGSVSLNGFQVAEMDTVSSDIFTLINFEAGEFNLVSSDKLYSYKLKGINYSSAQNALAADSFIIRPRYTDSDFTSRSKYQKNCIRAGVSKINAHDFCVDSYFKPSSLKSSFVEIGEMNMNVFRDNRKEFLHKKRTSLQDLIYNIPIELKVDSINLKKGRISYKIHAGKAVEPETIVINEIHAGMVNLTNDKLYKTKKGYLEIKADGRLMGKAKLTLSLKGKLYDKNNTLSVNGSLKKLDLRDFNPILEKNAFIYASGKIDEMNFSFVTDNARAKGRLTMLYDGLQITIKDKRSGDTTSLKTRFFSNIANRRILDSNPVKGEKVRVGIIDYERDPERFLFHYCFRSILTGINSTLIKNEKKGKRLGLIN
jgi:hypothetical protein